MPNRLRSTNSRRVVGVRLTTALAMTWSLLLVIPGPLVGQDRPIDRWLLSRPFSAASVGDEGPLPTVAELNPLFQPGAIVPPAPTQLEEDLAKADSIAGRPSNPELDEALGRRPPRRAPQGGGPLPGLRPGWMVRRDSVLFPERGTRVGATVWRLARQDGNPVFDLDTLVNRSGATATFAHAYLRPAADQTVTLLFSGLGCTEVSAKVNEQPLPLEADSGATDCASESTTASATVRLAAGWNALLVRVEGDSEPYGFAVVVSPGPGGESVDKLRIQASRPPGVQPIRPQASIDVMAIRVPGLEWRGDDLSAEVVVDFRLWGGSPPPDAEAKLEIGGEKAEYRFGQTPTGKESVESVFELVPLEKLRAVALGEGVSVRLEWKDHDEEMARRLAADRVLRVFHEPIQLRGWTGAGGNLPRAGAALTGEWKVPGWLSGFTLELLADDSPGDYTLDGRSLELENGRAVLCSGCPKKARLRLQAAATDDWSSLPKVRITGPGYADVADAEGAPPAEHWLRVLKKDDSEEYRKLLSEHAGGNGS